MKIIRIMSISKILIELCAIRQKVKIKNVYADIVCSVLSLGRTSKGLFKDKW